MQSLLCYFSSAQQFKDLIRSRSYSLYISLGRPNFRLWECEVKIVFSSFVFENLESLKHSIHDWYFLIHNSLIFWVTSLLMYTQFTQWPLIVCELWIIFFIHNSVNYYNSSKYTFALYSSIFLYFKFRYPFCIYNFCDFTFIFVFDIIPSIRNSDKKCLVTLSTFWYSTPAQQKQFLSRLENPWKILM